MDENFKIISSAEHSSSLTGIKKYIAPAAGVLAAVVICAAAVFAAPEQMSDDSGTVTENSIETDVISDEPVPAETEETFLSGDGDFAAEELAGYLKITVEADGEEQSVIAAPGSTVGEALAQAGVSLGEDDIVSADLDGKIINGSTVTVNRVKYVRQTHVRSYKFQTEYREDETLPEGSEEVVVDGSEGEIVIETLAKVVDGHTEDVEVLSKEITKPAVNRVVVTGALEVDTYNYAASAGTEEESGTSVSEAAASESAEEADDDAVEDIYSDDGEAAEGSFVSTALQSDEDTSDDIPEDISLDEGIDPDEIERVTQFTAPDWLELDENGVPVSYKETHTGKSCAYTAEPDALMSTGKTVFQGYVAVDPDIIPYGSELYIVADDGSVYGYAIAADTGYSVRAGDIIVDLFMNEYDDCIQWGAKNVTIYVLK